MGRVRRRSEQTVGGGTPAPLPLTPDPAEAQKPRLEDDLFGGTIHRGGYGNRQLARIVRRRLRSGYGTFTAGEVLPILRRLVGYVRFLRAQRVTWGHAYAHLEREWARTVAERDEWQRRAGQLERELVEEIARRRREATP